jgi:membrane-associated phospholipid phosphatase/tRNA A-37 threonylcarbamoyl transferase component Bud32
MGAIEDHPGDTAEPVTPSRQGVLRPGRRRRPSGEAPPLPRELGGSGKFLLLMVAYFASVLLGVLFFAPFERLFERWDTERMRWLASIRTSWLTDWALWVGLLASRWTIRILRWGSFLGLVVFRRWRHLLVFVGAIVTVEIVAYQTTLFTARPRPLGIEILGPWSGFSMPSRPLAGLAVTLVGMSYSFIPSGRWRYRSKWVIAVLLAVLCLVRVYLAVEQPTSAAFGAVFGFAVGLVAFRWFAPNDVYPVTYRRGKSAHLDVGGRRGEAIVRAIEDQLGFRVTEVKPVGLAGSGGSTPLRLRVEATSDDPQRYLFAKLYAKSHVRADRWYKLGRTILYGQLEDETPFQNVRRFVEYEDYTLRLMADDGLPVPHPYGIVEITPEREYMIVMEFFDGAVELGEAEVSDLVIDEGLALIRRMWDVGLAHRDVKPANLMVQDGELRLIDVFFVQVRPSPWRQAVDLANMMLVLALRSDAERVYRHALRWFTPDEIAEAFAAARGIASPTQLRSMVKSDGRNLVEEFRALAPAREPIRIQRWSLRRIGLTAFVLLVGLLSVSFVASNWEAFT